MLKLPFPKRVLLSALVESHLVTPLGANLKVLSKVSHDRFSVKLTPFPTFISVMPATGQER